MPLRYKSKGVPELPSDFKQVAEELLGPVDWQDTHSGFCKCPGEHLHTRPSGHRDCKVFIDDGVPTIHCFHDSCKDEVIAANFRLRSTIGKMTYRMNGHTGTMERPNRSAIEQHPFETFLKACFQPDDILSFAPGTILEGETRAIPEHSGINVFTRDQWLEKAEAKGGIGRLFSTRHGLYLRINPVTHKSNGSDKDVAAYRHTLIESDKIPKEDQERILRDSGLPIAALIDSGGESIHAWVRVDAKTKEEFHERRERLWESLPEGFIIDSQNKNPSRFSRCPGARRGEGFQKLLDVNIGPPSFEDWEQEADSLGLGPPLRISQLGEYDRPRQQQLGWVSKAYPKEEMFLEVVARKLKSLEVQFKKEPRIIGTRYRADFTALGHLIECKVDLAHTGIKACLGQCCLYQTVQDLPIVVFIPDDVDTQSIFKNALDSMQVQLIRESEIEKFTLNSIKESSCPLHPR